MDPPVACYREYLPCEALRGRVRAFFSFGPWSPNPPHRRTILRETLFLERDSFSSPLFADGHVSLVFCFSNLCRVDRCWHPLPTPPAPQVIGAMTTVGPPTGLDRPEMLGAYFRAAQAPPCLHIPASELTDRIAPLESLWGSPARDLASRLTEAHEAGRIERFESALLGRIAPNRRLSPSFDIAALALWMLRHPGYASVQTLAAAAGVSRQHLTATFREHVGVTPKRYARLARFQSGLAYAGSGTHIPWAQVAIDLGYSDQSHMIAEFREFSSLTPQALAARKWFHPFIERAKTRATGPLR